MRSHLVLAALLATVAASSYSPTALSCNGDGIGTSKQPNVAAATTQANAQATAVVADKPATPVATNASGSSAGGGIGTNDDGSGNLDDAVSAGSTRKHGLRWQSFLPGVIK